MNRIEIIKKLNEAKDKANEIDDIETYNLDTHDYVTGYTDGIDYALELLSLLTE